MTDTFLLYRYTGDQTGLSSAEKVLLMLAIRLRSAKLDRARLHRSQFAGWASLEDSAEARFVEANNAYQSAKQILQGQGFPDDD